MAGMRCIRCGGTTLVTDVRLAPDGTVVRQRTCKRCARTFHTNEAVMNDEVGRRIRYQAIENSRRTAK